jgi:hypothetical protein
MAFISLYTYDVHICLTEFFMEMFTLRATEEEQSYLLGVTTICSQV